PDSPSPPPVAYGAANFHNCTADGQVNPTPSPCPKGQSCRQDVSGNSYGCVVCVGTVNEGGSADTQCVAGNPPGIRTCNSMNNGYGSTTNCPNGDVCNDEPDPRGAFQ